MAEIIRKTIKGYNFVFDEIADPRVKSWFLVAKPYQGLAILALYLLFVLNWGPKFMKNRKPFNLDRIMIVYNAIQIFCCGYLFVRGIVLAWGWKYRWICEPVDFSESQRAMDIAKLCYYYLILKISDLLDTVFIVLRKKYSHLSFLHVYHHTGMVMLSWGCITYLPGGHGTSVGLINCFVHCAMYLYYLSSVAFPAVKQSLAVKKFVTQVQILQFLLLVVHFIALVLTRDCPYPKWVAALFLPQNTFMLALFVDFYIKTYIRKPKPKVTNKKEDNETTTYNVAREDENRTAEKEGRGNIESLIRNNHKNDSDLVFRNSQR